MATKFINTCELEKVFSSDSTVCLLFTFNFNISTLQSVVLKFVSLFVIVINWQIFPFQLSNICYWWQHKLAYISSMTKILILLGLICPLADYQPTWCYKFRSKLMLFFFRPTAYFLLSLLKLSRFTNVKYNTSIRKLIL